MSEQYKPVTADDVTDLALLPKRFDAFASEVRDSFDLLANRILPALERLESAIADIGVRVARLESAQVTTEHRLSALEARALKRKARK